MKITAKETLNPNNEILFFFLTLTDLFILYFFKIPMSHKFNVTILGQTGRALTLCE